MGDPSTGVTPGMLPELRIWDRFVRLAHWLFVAGFATAYLTADEVEEVHYIAGYAVATLLLMRIVWGFVGPRRARFADFVYKPARVLRYLRDLVRFRSERYVGHSPAGGAMVVALLVMLAAVTGSGMARLAVEKGEGPFAFWLASTMSEPETLLLLVSNDDGESETGDDDREDDRDRDKDRDEQRRDSDDRGKDSAIGELHEAFANALLVLIGAHVGGVLLASFAHRENLVTAMFTGRKRGGDAADP